MKNALIFAGGWDGHQPLEFARIFTEELSPHGITCQTITDLAPLADVEFLKRFDLIIPCWTMGQLAPEQSNGLLTAVREGVGLGGIHGGMGDAFRGNLDYEWMTGGHFVGHPHVGPYVVRRSPISHPITENMPDQFDYDSEQYYMMMEPGVVVLAETIYTYEEKTVSMPVAWVKQWSKGRVFYHALGHKPEEVSIFPEMRELTVRGLLWAAGLL